MANEQNLIPFKPGVSGNPKGRPPKELCLTNIAKKFLESIPEGEEKPRKQLFVEKVYELAMAGDTTCIKTYWQYMDGMPKQSIEIEGDVPISPLANEIKQLREDVKNNNSDNNNVKPETS